MPEVGGSGQRKLLSSCVLVLGAGGLGSSAIAYLAAAGVGTLGIIDNDLVEVSNLQRQIIHGGSIGLSKAKSAQNFILGIGELLVERLLCFNALDMTFYEAAFRKRNDCAICGERAGIVGIDPKNYLEYRPEECSL
ncbi:SAMP-activating enzyme E1 [uncultured archaeon]|nr:SAMP-activating enzyme E1 [uncultured archaeon]